MRRQMAAIAAIAILVATIASAASSTVIIESEGRVQEQALALRAAEVNPQNDRIIAVGEEGYAILLSSNNPTDSTIMRVLSTEYNVTLNSVSWHSGGRTAFLAGDSGIVLRYAESDHGVELVEGTGALESTDINAISWRNNGDRAYLGGEDGRIYSWDAENGFQLLDTAQSGSDITSISCHRHHSLCIVTTIEDGVAIIDRDSQVHWLGKTDNTWLDSICSDEDVNECIIIASGRRISALLLKPDDAGSSIIEEEEIIGELSGEFIGISGFRDNSVVIFMAPYSIIQYDLDSRQSYRMLEHEDVKDAELALSSTNIIHIWGEDERNGHTISSDGTVAEFSPPLSQESDLMTKGMIVLVAIAVPGSIFGLFFMNSKTLQGWYYSRRNAKRQKAKDQAIQLEKKQAADKKKQ